MADRGDGRDVIAVLQDDHRALAELFARFGRLQSGPAEQRRALADEVIIELVRHAVAEERHLYPAVRERLPDGDRIADREIADHAAAERTMKELERADAGEPQFDDIFGRLIREVTEHIRDEEENVLPRLAAACGAQELAELGEKVERAKRLAPTRPHPTAPDKPPLNKVIGPGVGLVDRARDLLHGRGAK